MLGCHSDFHSEIRNHEPLTLPSKVVRGAFPLYENKNVGYEILLYVCIYIIYLHMNEIDLYILTRVISQ